MADSDVPSPGPAGGAEEEANCPWMEQWPRRTSVAEGEEVGHLGV